MGNKNEIMFMGMFMCMGIIVTGNMGMFWGKFSRYSIDDSLECINQKNNTEILYIEKCQNITNQNILNECNILRNKLDRYNRLWVCNMDLVKKDLKTADDCKIAFFISLGVVVGVSMFCFYKCCYKKQISHPINRDNENQPNNNIESVPVAKGNLHPPPDNDDRLPKYESA